jgi:hypothetical protein
VNKRKRELLIWLIGLVLGASLDIAARAAIERTTEIQLWAVILMSIAIALGGYFLNQYRLVAEERAADWVKSAAEREDEWAKSTKEREDEWLKRVGTPAKLTNDLKEGEFYRAISGLLAEIKKGADVTVVTYLGRNYARSGEHYTANYIERAREYLDCYLKLYNKEVIGYYKRIICFDPDVFRDCSDLKSGVLRIGREPHNITGLLAEHCKLMLEKESAARSKFHQRSSTLIS